ncbi:mobile element protein [Vibrio ishigakensis]|uniref:Mobile element protein n=1 Tax=Vibrio ishigakensis TaxID=1481914 RepID=A0A0B8QK28_9VIBR|nr:mobile element protein [Vibrio ishigakensis]
MFYYQVKVAQKPSNYADERKLITRIFYQHKGRYGYRRIYWTLRNRGIQINHKTVYKLMRELGLKSTVRPKKYRSYKGELAYAAPNKLDRNFFASKPDEKWVTDVTEFKIKGQKVYLSPIIDLFNQEVVSYQVTKHVRLPLVLDMLKGAISKLPKGVQPLLHSDQGWQYKHKLYVRTLRERGIEQSMTRKGNCLDNAVAENFFSLLKAEMYHGQHFENADDLIRSIKEYIHYYNTERIKVKLKGLTPIEYRNQALKVA